MTADAPGPDSGRGTRRHRLVELVRGIVSARPDDIESALEGLAASRWWLAPLGWIIGTLVLLFRGVKVIIVNWRLTLVELVPAVWIGLTWWDLRVHLFGVRNLAVVHDLALVAVAVGVVAITVVSYWCNAVFAFAVEDPGGPLLRPAFRQARTHHRFVNAWGFGVGIAHAFVSTVVTRLGLFWFTLGMAGVAVVMMTTFVTVPAALVGRRVQRPWPQKVSGAAVASTLGVVASTPGFVLNRLGLLLLGFPVLRIPGLVVFAIGVALQTAAVSSVSAVKLTSQFVGNDRAASGDGQHPDRTAGEQNEETRS